MLTTIDKQKLALNNLLVALSATGIGLALFAFNPIGLPAFILGSLAINLLFSYNFSKALKSKALSIGLLGISLIALGLGLGLSLSGIPLLPLGLQIAIGIASVAVITLLQLATHLRLYRLEIKSFDSEETVSLDIKTQDGPSKGVKRNPDDFTWHTAPRI